MNSIYSLASHCVAMIAFGCLACSGAQPPAISSSVPIPGISGGGGSYAPVFDRLGGRIVVFLSHANNLVTNDNTSPFLDIFSYDLDTDTTMLVSVNRSGVGGGDADSAQAFVSHFGRFVIFASAASNLAYPPGTDTNGAVDIFLREIGAGVTSMPIGIIDPPPAASGTPLSGSPSIFEFGFVFESSTHFTWLPDTNNVSDVFITHPSFSIASINAAGTAAGNGPSERPVVSTDGQRIAFLSRATDLVSGVTNTQGDIYVRDLFTETTLWASSNVVEHLPGYRCHPPVLSTNAQGVVFKASAPGAANASVFHLDLATGVTSLLHTNSPTATDVVISGDGSTVAFDDGEQVFLWHGGVTTLVSKRADGAAPANGDSASPVLSLDGQIVAYVSAATDIVPDGVPATNTAYQIYVLNRQTGVTRLVTQNTNGVATLASHQFTHIALSPDGTQIAFDSLASDLVPGDLNAASDVFITPVATNDLKLISHRADSLPSLTAMRNVRITPECLTADKRFLLFASLDKNPPTDESFRSENLFIRDLTTGAEERITKFTTERLKEQVISANGRTVAYITQNRTNTSSEAVVVFDRTTGELIPADTNSLAGGFLHGQFNNLTISPDGRRLAYRDSSYLTAYLFDIELRSNRFANASFFAPRLVAEGGVSVPRFSPDGYWLAFLSRSQALTTNRSPGLFLVNLSDPGGLECIPTADFGVETPTPTFSGDSRYVCASDHLFDLTTRAFSRIPTILELRSRRNSLDANGRIITWEAGYGGSYLAITNRQTGITKVLNANAGFTSITPDGRCIVFASRSTNLVSADKTQKSDIYLHDLRQDVTLLLSKRYNDSAAGNGSSTMPILSADGRTVLFQSFADDLTPGDYNFSRDIFMAHIGGPDSDGDQMDDDWEMAYFSTLSRNGTGDFDGDGAADFAEFEAGTDPTDLGSILRVISITSLNGGHTRLVWSSSPGRTYQVQYKDNVDDAQWSNLGAPITPVSTTASLSDAPANGRMHRFYRVQLIQ